MSISIIITTRNRSGELQETLRALTALSPAPDEILVCLDGCLDDSREMLQENFPSVRVLWHSKPLGSIPSRDRLMRESSGDLVLSLDDDSHPMEPNFLEVGAKFFADDSRLAVLWFPQISDEFPASLTSRPLGADTETGSYLSSGAILRRAAYLDLPGYFAQFHHAYEEPDYALQCVAAGWTVKRHMALTIRHLYSGQNRNEMRTHHLHARNEQWSILLRCPTPWWPLMMLRRAGGQLLFACRRGPAWVVNEPKWWWQAVRGAASVWAQRRPVPWSIYREWLRLLRQ